MKRVSVAVIFWMSTAALSPVHAFCVYADRQYSEGATLCISPTATQTCLNTGNWTKLEPPQTQGSACERAYQTPNSVTISVSPEKRRDIGEKDR